MKNSRQVALDTETTGLSPEQGHRIIEIGCVELINGFPTNNHFHVYVNPERDVPDDAFQIHGLSTEFLQDKPSFNDIYEKLMDFIGDAHLIIHNAAFDLKFLKAECKRIGRVFIHESEVTDTLKLARKRFPGAKANLDALCARYGINAQHRSKHGALVDAELLALVYVEMHGGAQRDMLTELHQPEQPTKRKDSLKTSSLIRTKEKRALRSFPLSTEEIEKHRDFLRKLKYPLWAAVEESYSS